MADSTAPERGFSVGIPGFPGYSSPQSEHSSPEGLRLIVLTHLAVFFSVLGFSVAPALAVLCFQAFAAFVVLALFLSSLVLGWMATSIFLAIARREFDG